MKNELIIAGISFALGLTTAMVMFRWGASYATDLIYKIKEDIPLEKMGKPFDHDFSDEE